MPWVGAEASVDPARLRECAESLGLHVLGELEVEVRTSRGWVRFRVLEVAGFVEGAARTIAQRLGCAALEGGRHLILGEASARLWDEAVLVVFGDGSEEVVPVFTYDGFLDLRMPKDTIRGVRGSITVAGKSYQLPLSAEDLKEIASRGGEWLRKVEKAASVYGLSRVVSPDALSRIEEIRSAGVRVEVDYESGFVMIREVGADGRVRVSTRPLVPYVLELALAGDYRRAAEIVGRAPEDLRKEIVRTVEEEAEMQRSIGRYDNAARLSLLLEEIKKLTGGGRGR